MNPHSQSIRESTIGSRRLPGLVLALSAGSLLAGCGVTSRMEPYKQTDAVIGTGEQVVVLARKHHASHEAEGKFVECISEALARGDHGIEVHSSTLFEDTMYPWFEPSTAPLDTLELAELLDRPGVLDRVEATGVRFLIWLDGSTDRVSSGGGITCAAGVGGAGCMGLAWWEDDATYDATVWDINELANAGTIHADFSGRSVMPAIIIPLPFIARPQAKACRGLTDQLEQFLTSPSGDGDELNLG
ncbi:hypothetical protein [Candidatus Rariloculus sp.]|uniref:hypothetical protein n=1 Tax=Candidatus Rariloculus sp. TaxID=3101265 RepID=UPI003D135058